MLKTKLCDLKRKMFIRSTLLGLSGLGEILGLNDEISEDEVLLEIIKMALREFELTEPLILEMPVNTGQLGTWSSGMVRNKTKLYTIPGLYHIRVSNHPTSNIPSLLENW